MARLVATVTIDFGDGTTVSATAPYDRNDLDELANATKACLKRVVVGAALDQDIVIED